MGGCPIGRRRERYSLERKILGQREKLRQRCGPRGTGHSGESSGPPVLPLMPLPSVTLETQLQGLLVPSHPGIASRKEGILRPPELGGGRFSTPTAGIKYWYLYSILPGTHLVLDLDLVWS